VDELVIDLVQLRAVCIKDLALGLVSGAAYGTVGADLVLISSFRNSRLP